MTSGRAIVRVTCPSPGDPMRSLSTGPALGDGGGRPPAAFSSPDAIPPATSRARILVADNDGATCQKLVAYLGEHWLSHGCACSRQEILHAISRLAPDLVLLDTPAEERDGFRLLREIRSRSDVPIILATSYGRDEVDRILALELGADDYLEQPFSPRELLARIRAMLRRCELTRNAARRSPERGGFRFAGWQLHRRSRRLIAPSGEIVPMTKGEYALLVAFLSAPQRPLSREQLLQATRLHDNVFDRSIDVQVLRLRRKLEIDPAAQRFIRTERGVGYVFAIPVEAY
jgi:two-component system OmpR family response regulator